MTELLSMSVRQLMGKWRLIIVAGLAGLPVLSTVLSVIFGDASGARLADEIDDAVLQGMFASAIVPLVTLAFAGAAFGNEIEDSTLANLYLTPVARWRIVAPKFLATLVVALVVVAVSALASFSVGYEGDATAIAAAVIGLCAGVVAYSSAFLWLGLVAQRAIAVGLVYVLLWEGLFSGFVNGIKYFSIRQYMLGIVQGIDSDRLGSNLLSFEAAIIGTVVVTALFLFLSVRRLRRMDIP